MNTTSMPLFAWSPPEKIAVFPAIRRRHMIEKTARSAAAAKDPEKTIAYTIKRLRDSHERRGIPVAQADADVAALERAIRHHVWAAAGMPSV